MSDAPAYAESLYPQRELGWAPLFAWRTARYKLDRGAAARSSTTSPRDPARRRTGPRRENARLAPMRGAAAGRRSPGRRPTRAATLDAETSERLRALGYVGGGAAAPRPASTRCATRRTASGSCRGLNPA